MELTCFGTEAERELDAIYARIVELASHFDLPHFTLDSHWPSSSLQRQQHALLIPRKTMPTTSFNPTASTSSVASSSISRQSSTGSEAIKWVARSPRTLAGLRRADIDALDREEYHTIEAGDVSPAEEYRPIQSSKSSPSVSVKSLSLESASISSGPTKPRLIPRNDREERRRRERKLFSEDDGSGDEAGAQQRPTKPTPRPYPRRHTSAGTSITSSISLPLVHGPVDNAGVVCKTECALHIPSALPTSTSMPGMGSMRAGAALLAKAPLLRDVPGMRRKTVASKRESTHLLDSELVPTNADDAKGKGTLREKPSRSSLAIPPGTIVPGVTWRPVVAVLRDGGLLSLIADETVIVELSVASFVHTDIHLVDPTLLLRSDCLSIRTANLASVASPPPTPGISPESLSRSASASRFPAFGLSGRPAPPAEDMPLSASPTGRFYLSFPSSSSLHTFYATAQCFTRSPGPIPSLWPLYGTAPTEERPCRLWRGIELQIVEGRGLGERAASPNSGSLSTSSSQFSISQTLDDKRAHVVGMVRNVRSGQPGERPLSADSDSSQTISASTPSSQANTPLELTCEVIVNDEVVGRTASRRGTASPFWREHYHFCDLPPLGQPLEIRVYQIWHRKTPPKTLLGSVQIPVASMKRSETVEEWFPVVQRDPKRHEAEHVGDLNLSIKFDEIRVLSGSDYEPLRALLADDDDLHLAYDLVAEMPHHLERVADLLIRIYHAEGKLLTRMMQMADIEIDGDASSANILFRGKSLLTKTLELYLRLVGTDFLQASVGDVVTALCKDRIDIEIDPSRLKTGPKEKTLAEQTQDLERWTTYLWNSLYQARHKCPNELRQLFQHIQHVVESRYDAKASPMRFTCISAFVFLRFFVPALLNTKLFGLTFSHPSPPCQRTLTLIAKTLQTLANMRGFDKEPYMACMNGFVQSNTDAFVDYISHISRPVQDARPGWTSPLFPGYEQASALRRDLVSDEHRDRVPLLPHLFDESKDLALLASLVSRTRVDALRRSGGGELPPPSVAASPMRTVKHSSRSTGIDRLIVLCVDLHTRAACLADRTQNSRPSTPSNAVDESFEMLASPGSRSPSVSPRRPRVTTLPSGEGDASDTSRSKYSLTSLTRLSLANGPSSPRSRRSHTVSSATGVALPDPPLTAVPIIPSRNPAMLPGAPTVFPLPSTARLRRVSGSDQRVPLTRARSDTVTSNMASLLPAEPIEIRIPTIAKIDLADEPVSPRRRLFRVRP